VLAAFDDGTPFLTREVLGRGEIYFLNSLPLPEWSTLDEGTVLVPFLQRCLVAGSRRLQQAASFACGELPASAEKVPWITVDSSATKDPRFQAGVYRSGEQWIAVNRPEAEDDLEILPTPDAQKLFGNLPVQALQENRQRSDALQGEIWRLLLLALLIFLIAEGVLILPGSSAAAAHGKPVTPPRQREVAA
jgi:hypothetical protein